METTIVYWGYISGNRELYKDNGKENGNYYLGFGPWYEAKGSDRRIRGTNQARRA